MLNNKNLGFLICLTFFTILFSNNILAAPQLTLSNLKVLDINGNVMDETNPTNPSHTIGSTEEFYLIFDVTNNGDTSFAGSFTVYAPGHTPDNSIYEIMGTNGKFSLYSSALVLNPGETLTNYKLRTRFESITCKDPTPKKFSIATAYTNYATGMKDGILIYEGGSDCHALRLTKFEWKPDHPAYIRQDPSLQQKYGFSYVIKNNDPVGTPIFSGLFNITGISGNLTSRKYCSTTIEKELSPGEEITLTMPEECDIMLLGSAYITANNSATHNIIPIANAIQSFNYYVDIPVWVPFINYINKFIYAPRDIIYMYSGSAVQLIGSSGPLLKSIPANSIYHIFVKNYFTNQLIYEEYKTIGEELMPGRYFGTLPSYIGSTNYFLGETNFTAPDPVPDGITISMEIMVPEDVILYQEDSDNKRIIINGGGRSLLSYYIELTPKIPCDPDLAISSGDHDCDCSKSIDKTAKRLVYNCNLKRTNMIINKQYIGRFKFNDKLEAELQKRFISVASSIGEPLVLSFTSSIEFPTKPDTDPDPSIQTEYTLSFNCDLDGDDYLSSICETDPTKIDCDDSDPAIYLGAPEICDGKNNDCNDIADVVSDGSEEDWYNNPAPEYGVGACLNDAGGYWVCINGQQTNTCTPLAPTSETCDDETGYNLIDENCDGTPLDCNLYCDQDGDGYTPHLICAFLGYNIFELDCDDANNLINPDAQEIYCNGISESCGKFDDAGTDSDEDGYKIEDGLCGLADCNDNDNTIYPNAPELCDSKDNQCPDNVGYGSIDENYPTKELCTAGIGACQREGIYICSSDKISVECNAIQGIPATEICDGIDNDCNGIIDDAFEGCSCIDGQTQLCYSGSIETANVGECKMGIQTCSFGSWGLCSGEILPQTEICEDGIDQDCDGFDLACENKAPSINIISPNDGDTLTGIFSIEYIASDPDVDDVLTITLDYSRDGGLTWCPATWNCKGVKIYSSGEPLDTTTISNGEYIVRLTVRDGRGLSSSDEVKVYVNNLIPQICDPNVLEECNGVDDNCDNYTDVIPIINGLLFKDPLIPTSQITSMPSAINVVNTDEKTVTLQVTNSSGDPIERIKVCIESCDTDAPYITIKNLPYETPPYPVEKNVIFDKNYGITDSNGEVMFNYFVYSGENIITFKVEGYEDLIIPISFSKA